MYIFEINDKVKVSTLTGKIIGWGSYRRTADAENHRAALVELDQPGYLKDHLCFVSILVVHEDNLIAALDTR